MKHFDEEQDYENEDEKLDLYDIENVKYKNRIEERLNNWLKLNVDSSRDYKNVIKYIAGTAKRFSHHWDYEDSGLTLEDVIQECFIKLEKLKKRGDLKKALTIGKPRGAYKETYPILGIIIKNHLLDVKKGCEAKKKAEDILYIADELQINDNGTLSAIEKKRRNKENKDDPELKLDYKKLYSNPKILKWLEGRETKADDIYFSYKKYWRNRSPVINKTSDEHISCPYCGAPTFSRFCSSNCKKLWNSVYANMSLEDWEQLKQADYSII